MNTVAVAVTLTAALLMSAGCFGGARIISSFGDSRGPEGYPRTDGPHNGIDVAGLVGQPVLAAADGVIGLAKEDHGSCGTIVLIHHAGPYHTVYCHLQDITKSSGSVSRGEVIGHLGTTGMKAGRGFEHVHLILRENGVPIDPMTKMVGCFDPQKTYSTDHLVLTYPVACKN